MAMAATLAAAARGGVWRRRRRKGRTSRGEGGDREIDEDGEGGGGASNGEGWRGRRETAEEEIDVGSMTRSNSSEPTRWRRENKESSGRSADDVRRRRSKGRERQFVDGGGAGEEGDGGWGGETRERRWRSATQWRGWRWRWATTMDGWGDEGSETQGRWGRKADGGVKWEQGATVAEAGWSGCRRWSRREEEGRGAATMVEIVVRGGEKKETAGTVMRGRGNRGGWPRNLEDGKRRERRRRQRKREIGAEVDGSRSGGR